MKARSHPVRARQASSPSQTRMRMFRLVLWLVSKMVKFWVVWSPCSHNSILRLFAHSSHSSLTTRPGVALLHTHTTAPPRCGKCQMEAGGGALGDGGPSWESGHHPLNHIRGSQKILEEGLGFPRRGGGQSLVSIAPWWQKVYTLQSFLTDVKLLSSHNHPVRRVQWSSLFYEWGPENRC